MNEERMFVLKMIEEGKITAEQGAALLEAMRDEAYDAEARRGSGQETPPPPPHQESGARPGADADSRQGPAGEPRTDGERERAGAEGAPRGEERGRRPRPADIAAQIREAIQAALKGVPHVTEELKENWKEVSEDVRNSFHEIRDEIRTKGLIDVSGLVELFSHMRDVGFGHTHEFVDEIEGQLAAESPRIELVTTNGAVTVRGWDKPGYRLSLRKRLHAADEAKAREVAEGMVELTREDGLLRASARHVRNASVSMELWIPDKGAASIEVRSENGSIRLEDLSCQTAHVATTNGSVHLTRVSADLVKTTTTNGRISCSDLEAKRAEANTTNGGVSWSGVAESGDVKTVNGSAHLEPRAPKTVGAGAPESEAAARIGATSRYQVSTVNGSVHVDLPGDEGVGISATAACRSVRVDGDESRLAFGGNGGEERRARTPDYDGAARKIDLVLRTVNGSIRLHVPSKGSRDCEGGDPGACGEDANPQDA